MKKNQITIILWYNGENNIGALVIQKSETLHLFVDGSFNYEEKLMSAGCVLLEGRTVIAESYSESYLFHEAQAHEAFAIIIGLNLAIHRCKENSKIHVYNDDLTLRNILIADKEQSLGRKYFHSKRNFIKKIWLMVERLNEKNIAVYFHRFSDNQTPGLRRAHHISRKKTTQIPYWKEHHYKSIKLVGDIRNN